MSCPAKHRPKKTARTLLCSGALVLAGSGAATAQQDFPWAIWEDGSGNEVTVQLPSGAEGPARNGAALAQGGVADETPAAESGVMGPDADRTGTAPEVPRSEAPGTPPIAGLPGEDGGIQPTAETGPGEGPGPVGETIPGAAEGSEARSGSPAGQAEDVAQPRDAAEPGDSLIPTEPRGEMAAEIDAGPRVATIEQASPLERCVVSPAKTMADPLPPLIKHPGIQQIEEYEPEAPEATTGISAEVPVPPAPRRPQIAPEPSPPIDSRADFLRTALLNSLLGLRTAEVAARQASSEHIRMFAERIIFDQRVMNRDLWAIGDCYAIDLPRQLPDYLRDEVTRLEMLSGPAFDHRYLLKTIELDQQALYAFDQQMGLRDDLMIKKFARTYSPIIHVHMAHASSIATALAPTAGADFTAPVAYFDRFDYLGQPWSRGIPALQVRGPTPGELNIMPTNTQPATAGAHSVPVPQQIARGGPGTGIQPATEGIVMGETVPANPDLPYQSGVPQHAGAIQFDRPTEDQLEALAALEALEGAPVASPDGVVIGTVTEIQARNGRADLATLRFRVDGDWSVGDRNFAVPVGAVEIEDGAVIADLDDLLARGLAYSTDRPVAAPPVRGGEAPEVAIRPVWTAKGGFGWWNQGR